MFSKDEFIEAIVSEVAPVIAEKAGPAASAAIEEYRQYAEQKYGHSYDKIIAKLDALATSVVAKAAAADCRAVEGMDFSDLIAEPEVEPEDQELDDIVDDDLDDVVDDDLDEPEVPNDDTLGFVDDDLGESEQSMPFVDQEPEDLSAGLGNFDELDEFESVLPPSPELDEFDAFAAAFADFEDDDLSDAEADDEFDDVDEVLDGIAGEVMSKEEDDIDIESGNNASIPVSALYAFEDAGDAVRYPDDPAMDWLSATSNEVFKYVKFIIDGSPRIDDDATYEQVSDTLYQAVFDVSEENKDLAATMSMETALDLMYVYGKSDNLSVRGQLYSTRTLPVIERKKILAERIAHDTGRALSTNIASKFSEDEEAVVSSLCEQYAKVKVDTMFEKIGESNLDVLDDLRRVLMEREPERFADKGSAYIRKYMQAYIDRYGS